MKNFRKLLVFSSLAIIAFHCFSQTANTKTTPRDILAKCYSACSNFNYDAIKECITQRNAVYVDMIKQKFENPDKKFQKDLIAAAIQTAKYDILEEKISATGKMATLKTKVSVLEQTFTTDVVLIVENNKWKIDDLPNVKDIPSQIPMLQMFIK
ncbi:MAG: hypothetical protein LBE11_04360 [Prevotellaceae bacterium]|jgi:hypothetical protein|nr:hypothetical protein [Prevotellaceae bacterium]